VNPKFALVLIYIGTLLFVGGCSFPSGGKNDSETEAPQQPYVDKAKDAQETVEQDKPDDPEEGEEGEETESDDRD
jgi:hypothetical protein